MRPCYSYTCINSALIDVEVNELLFISLSKQKIKMFKVVFNKLKQSLFIL